MIHYLLYNPRRIRRVVKKAILYFTDNLILITKYSMMFAPHRGDLVAQERADQILNQIHLHCLVR